jgi:hypothetical protein
MKTNFNSVLDQLDNGLSLKSYIFGIIMIIISSFAMLSNIFALLVINKFKKNNEAKGKQKEDKPKEEERTITTQIPLNTEGNDGGALNTEQEQEKVNGNEQITESEPDKNVNTTQLPINKEGLFGNEVAITDREQEKEEVSIDKGKIIEPQGITVDVE